MPIQPLLDDELPPLYRTASASSLEAQRRFLSTTKARLFLLTAAAAFGLFTWKFRQSPTDWAGVLASGCFGITLILEIYLLTSKPDRTWYEGRAAAESAKTLSWRYAVGGLPFGVANGRADRDTDELFLAQLKDLLVVLKDLDVTALQVAGQQITPQMREARSAPLEDRKAIYEKYRVADQQAWYAQKASWNQRRARRWATGMVIVESAGLFAGILKAIGLLPGDFLGLAGATVATMTAWLQTKQHRELATAYTVTALELASVRSKIPHQTNDADWSTFVSDAEEAFSREHTLWKASRGVHSL